MSCLRHHSLNHTNHILKSQSSTKRREPKMSSLTLTRTYRFSNKLIFFFLPYS